MIDFFIQALITFLVVIDPVGTLAVFIALTEGTSKAYRRRMAIKGSLIAWAVLLLFAFGGQALLKNLGISIDAFRIAGGIFLFVIAFEMLFDKRTKRKQASATELTESQDHQHDENDDIGVFPLGMPLLAGPGAITAVMLFAGDYQATDIEFVLMIIAFSLLLILCMLLFIFSQMIHKLLGNTFNHVLSRLLGMLLAALACQFVIDGVAGATKNAYT